MVCLSLVDEFRVVYSQVSTLSTHHDADEVFYGIVTFHLSKIKYICIYGYTGQKVGAGIIKNVACTLSSLAASMYICIFWVCSHARINEGKRITKAQGKTSTYLFSFSHPKDSIK